MKKPLILSGFFSTPGMGKGDCPLSREVCPARGRMPTAADIRVERNQSDRREKVKGRKETEQVHVGIGAAEILACICNCDAVLDVGRVVTK
jgi:hypothetical protein